MFHTRAALLASALFSAPALDPFTGPNVERMTADPSVCFIEGGEGGEVGTDGGTQTEAPQYTKADMERAVSQRVNQLTKKHGTELEGLKAQLGGIEEMKAKLAQLEEERDNAGKSASELAQKQAQKELDKLRREIEDGKKALGESSAREAKALADLRTDRATTRVMGALSSEKAINAERAAKYAMTEIAFTHHDDGSMTATYGDVEDGSPADAVKAWLKDNDNFLPAPAGGAGTPRNGGAGRSTKSTADMSPDELASEVARMDALNGRR